MTRILPLLVCLSLLTTLASVGFAAADGHETGGRDGCTVPLDVLFVFDTTGSMGGVLSDATSGAGSVMAAIQSQVPDAAFGVADFKDYAGYFAYPGYANWYGGGGDYPWKLRQPIDTDPAATSAAIATLSAAGGADWPESMTRAIYESYSDVNVGWRAGSLRIVVLFTDAPAHDEDFAGNDFGSEPGPDNVAGTSDDLEFESTVADAAANGIIFAGVGVGGNGGAPYLQYLAAQTDGEYTVLGGDFVGEITSLILALGGVRAEAHSDAVLADISTLAAEHLNVAHVEAGPHNDAHSETFNTLTLPSALAGYLKTGAGKASTNDDGTTRKAAARHTIEEVSVLGGLVRASLLRSDASVTVHPWGAQPSTGATHVAELWIAGTPVTVNGPTTIPLPGGIGYVAVEETIVNQPTWDTAEVEVNALRVHVDVPGLLADIKISHAYAGIVCNGSHHDGPTPPQDPPVPTGPIDPITPDPFEPITPGPIAPECVRVGDLLVLCPEVDRCSTALLCLREIVG